MKEKRRKIKKEEKEIEEKVIRILTGEKLSAIKALLEKDHAIDCLFMLYLNKGRWGETKEFMTKLGKHISDGTFRARMYELELLESATHKNIRGNPKQKHYMTTDLGKKVAKLLMNFFDRIL